MSGACCNAMASGFHRHDDGCPALRRFMLGRWLQTISEEIARVVPWVLIEENGSLRSIVAEVESLYDAADEERYERMEEWRREAEKWKSKDDMYGWNFHQGMVAGANWVNLFFYRVKRKLEKNRCLNP